MAYRPSMERSRANAAEMELLHEVVRLCIQKLGPLPAKEFLNTPHSALDGLRPLDVALHWQDGLRTVEKLLDAPTQQERIA